MKNKRAKMTALGVITTIVVPVIFQCVGVESSITLAVITAVGSLILAYLTGQSYTDKTKYEGIYKHGMTDEQF